MHFQSGSLYSWVHSRVRGHFVGFCHLNCNKCCPQNALLGIASHERYGCDGLKKLWRISCRKEHCVMVCKEDFLFSTWALYTASCFFTANLRILTLELQQIISSQIFKVCLQSSNAHSCTGCIISLILHLKLNRP